MDYRKLAENHLKDAVSKGFITLETVQMDLKANEILGVCKWIIKEGLLQDSPQLESQGSMPSEMFSSGPLKVKSPDLDKEFLLKLAEEDHEY